jgi:hypothetical protein
MNGSDLSAIAAIMAAIQVLQTLGLEYLRRRYPTTPPPRLPSNPED